MRAWTVERGVPVREQLSDFRSLANSVASPRKPRTSFRPTKGQPLKGKVGSFHEHPSLAAC